MIAAWAHSMTDKEIANLLAPIPTLGAVLYPRQYHLSRGIGRPMIAYCPTPRDAKAAAEYPMAGMILGRDEPNVRGEGPSGAELAPTASRAQYDHGLMNVQDHPAWKVPGSLVPAASWWRALMFRSLFDDEYHKARGVPEVAWSGSRATLREIQSVRRNYPGPQYVGPALFRSWPGRWLQVSPEAFIRFAQEDPNTHLAIWSLREVDAPHQPFGLYDRENRMTRVGQAVKDALED